MISLTKHEKYILIFLIFTGFLGTGLLFYKKALKGTIIEYVQVDPAQFRQSSSININTATEEELITLKGVGPKLATRIIAYRKRNGCFSTKEDLKKVSGIGPAKFDNIKDIIRVE